MTATPAHRFLPVIRELARTYQVFEQLSGNHIRELGLTPPQFDVIATLGNTSGMSCKLLSEKTLITKGTLTGVVDRLIDKGLVSRRIPDEDRRSVFIALTVEGEALFARVFPAHLDHMQKLFDTFSETELEQIQHMLARLRTGLDTARKTPS